MLSLLPRVRAKPHRGDRYVDAGRVYCPRHATDIDVERCLTCPWLRQAALEQAPAWLRCAPPAEVLQPPYSGLLTTGRERRH